MKLDRHSKEQYSSNTILLLTSFALFLAIFFSPLNAAYGQVADRPSILIVTAHPDDDALFAGAIYRAAVELGGDVDLALVTDGAGGYRYSTLSEPIYNIKLTEQEIAKQHLPAIRKQELMAGGKIVGVRNYFFLDQPDTGYTQDPDSILSYVWDAASVQSDLVRIMKRNRYDFVFTALPRIDTHAHHKAASILAIRSAATLKSENRPVVLGSWIKDADGGKLSYAGLENYSDTNVLSESHQFEFDRLHPIGLQGRLNYKIVVNWLIAEHKSQGTMQLLMNRGDQEAYWVYTNNPDDALSRTEAFFALLNTYD